MREATAPLLITGGSGFLGAAIRRAAPGAAYTYFEHAPGRDDPLAFRLDVRDAGAVERLIARLRPSAIIHTAYTNDPSAMHEVIVEGSRAVAGAARRAGAALVHVSTDQVFDGERAPYDEDDAPDPVIPYGEAKAEAERSVHEAYERAIVARASLLYSLTPPDPRLARTSAALARGDAVTLFTDEIRCPAHVADVAAALLELVARLRTTQSVPRFVHVVGPEPLVRRDFELACLRAVGADPSRVREGTIADSAVRRPRDLTLRTRGTPAEVAERIRPLAYWLGVAGAPEPS